VDVAHAARVVLLELRRLTAGALKRRPVDGQAVDRGLEFQELLTPPAETLGDVAVLEEVRIGLGDADGELTAGFDYSRCRTRSLRGLGGLRALLIAAASCGGAEREKADDR
jgi:hypothetical protein